jgi:hypothetical protein
MKCSEGYILLQLGFLIELQSFKWKIRDTRSLRKRSLKDKEQHLALGMLTSEITHARGKREKTPAKQQ